MVATDDDCQQWGNLFASIVSGNVTIVICYASRQQAWDLLIEVTKLPILWGHGHALQIAMISDGLEVTTDEEQLDLVVIPVLQRLYLLVDGIECAMTTALYSNLPVVLSTRRDTLRAYQADLHDRCIAVTHLRQ